MDKLLKNEETGEWEWTQVGACTICGLCGKSFERVEKSFTAPAYCKECYDSIKAE